MLKIPELFSQPAYGENGVLGDVLLEESNRNGKSLPIKVKEWVTMGGEPCDHGKHCGGSHVELDGEGKIKKGPKGTIGKKPDELKTKPKPAKVKESPFKKEELPKEQPAEKPATHGSDLKETVKNGSVPDYVGKPITASKKSLANTEELLNKLQGGYLQKLSKNQIKAIKGYTSDGYSRLNETMRKCPPDFECLEWTGLEEKVTELESALAKAPALSEPITTYRGMEVMNKGLQEELRSKLKLCLDNGIEFTFGQFVSSSIDPLSEYGEMATGVGSSLFFQIKAKKGLYIAPISYSPDEMEFLQSANTKYKVMAIVDGVEFSDDAYVKEKKRVIYLEEV